RTGRAGGNQRDIAHRFVFQQSRRNRRKPRLGKHGSRPLANCQKETAFNPFRSTRTSATHHSDYTSRTVFGLLLTDLVSMDLLSTDLCCKDSLCANLLYAESP